MLQAASRHPRLRRHLHRNPAWVTCPDESPVLSQETRQSTQMQMGPTACSACPPSPSRSPTRAGPPPPLTYPPLLEGHAVPPSWTSSSPRPRLPIAATHQLWSPSPPRQRTRTAKWMTMTQGASPRLRNWCPCPQQLHLPQRFRPRSPLLRQLPCWVASHAHHVSPVASAPPRRTTRSASNPNRQLPSRPSQACSAS